MMVLETGWLILGANGQLGRALQTVLSPRDDVTFWGRDEGDLSQPESLKAKLEAIQPTAIINAAAYTAVDKAEEERELAYAVNAESVGVMAEFCAARTIPLVHYSTDYVFNGSGDQPWREDDTPNPINVYGESKLAGEQAITRAGCHHLIFRTSWVYDAQGNNFLNTMLKLGAEREELRVVDDQIGAPTYAPDLAEISMECLNKALEMSGFPSGIYHCAGGGEPISWHGFAEAIFEQAEAMNKQMSIKSLLPIPSSDYLTSAARPLNSRLSMEKLNEVFSLSMRHWRESLKDAIELKR